MNDNLNSINLTNNQNSDILNNNIDLNSNQNNGVIADANVNFGIPASPPLPKKKKSKFPIVLLFLIIIGIGGYFLYTKFFVKSSNVYETVINYIYEQLLTEVNNAEAREIGEIDFTKPMVIDLNARLDSKMDLLKNYTGIDYHLTFGSDILNKKLKLGFDIKDKNDVLLEMILYLIKDSAYLKSNFYNLIDLDGLKEVTGTDIDFDIEQLFETISDTKIEAPKLDYDAGRYVLAKLKTILINSIDKDKLSINGDNIIIQDKKHNVTNSTYILDKENVLRTINYIRKEILKDEKFIESLIDFTGLLENDTVRDIIVSDSSNTGINYKEQLILEIKDALSEEITIDDIPTLTISLYTDNKNNIIAGDIKVEDSFIRFENFNGMINATFSEKDKVVGTLSYQDGTLIIKYLEDEKITGTLTLKNKNNALTAELKADNLNLAAGITDIKNEKDKYTGKFNLSVDLTLFGQKVDLKLTGSYGIESKNIEDIDINESIKLTDMNTENYRDIIDNIREKLKRFGLEDLIEPLSYPTDSFEIIDKTIGSEASYAQAFEEFYRDNYYSYSFNFIKSAEVEVHYFDGTVENIKEALAKGHITIEDLDRFNISYNKVSIDN